MVAAFSLAVTCISQAAAAIASLLQSKGFVEVSAEPPETSTILPSAAGAVEGFVGMVAAGFDVQREILLLHHKSERFRDGARDGG